MSTVCCSSGGCALLCGAAQVTHLTIFVEDNQGDEEVTRLEAVRLFGSSGQSMDVAAIKKVEEG